MCSMTCAPRGIRPRDFRILITPKRSNSANSTYAAVVLLFGKAPAVPGQSKQAVPGAGTQIAALLKVVKLWPNEGQNHRKYQCDEVRNLKPFTQNLHLPLR